MPELPEVETIRKGLEQYLVGHRIEDIEVRLAKMVTGEVQKVQNAKVQGVRRFGKGLVIDLDNEYSIAIHIKMTGQLIYRGEKLPSSLQPHPTKVGKTLPNSATHVIFQLDNNAVLYYNDIRQFGWIKIVKTAEVAELPFFKELGPEPFKDLTLDVFTKIIHSVKKAPIKSVLMDQKKIGGIGNIYANDALFQSRIHPKRLASSLADRDIETLFTAIEKVMKKGLEVGGASEWQYVNALGQTGNYQRFFQAYGQDGKPCPRCGTKIVRMTLAGRGTFFCPSCQSE